MMSRASHPKLPFLGLLALALLVSPGCQAPQTTSSQATPPAKPEPASSTAPAAPLRDLSQDEAEGGHTLRKHVGRTDDELRQRLRHERNIAAASTWTDRAVAEQAVGLAIAHNRDASQAAPCSRAVIVLKRTDNLYYVLTAYPECR